jgi:hypothetical protein
MLETITLVSTSNVWSHNPVSTLTYVSLVMYTYIPTEEHKDGERNAGLHYFASSAVTSHAVHYIDVLYIQQLSTNSRAPPTTSKTSKTQLKQRIWLPKPPIPRVWEI